MEEQLISVGRSTAIALFYRTLKSTFWACLIDRDYRQGILDTITQLAAHAADPLVKGGGLERERVDY